MRRNLRSATNNLPHHGGRVGDLLERFAGSVRRHSIVDVVAGSGAQEPVGQRVDHLRGSVASDPPPTDATLFDVQREVVPRRPGSEVGGRYVGAEFHGALVRAPAGRCTDGDLPRHPPQNPVRTPAAAGPRTAARRRQRFSCSMPVARPTGARLAPFRSPLDQQFYPTVRGAPMVTGRAVVARRRPARLPARRPSR